MEANLMSSNKIWLKRVGFYSVEIHRREDRFSNCFFLTRATHKQKVSLLARLSQVINKH